ncbi:hypothetical protein [Pseudolactococcus reticulitermitis]|uniref:DUF2798 domain-containing protein n=1 Tax=Pseudolactococcus reticulitermitis TaxID=2025039 RepID=A0A224XE23_9LACT|nr:hypothetical protein [Lactococcus reticulitermitis]GAX48152.1 hypothetical protein RsY01_1767 [Lactococcus reticulitermitis]
MDFYMKLPRNGKEFALFLGIVATISVNMIAPVISGFEVGFSLATWRYTLMNSPVMLVAVIICVLLTHMPAEKLAAKVTAETDSFNAKITLTILINVAMMSVLMTIVGAMIATKTISLAPFQHFFDKWPRNFTIALVTELLIAQPIARFVLYQLHQKSDKGLKTTISEK